MTEKRCIGGCCDNRPGWEWIEDPITHERERRRQPPQPGQHGTPGHECRPRLAGDGSSLCYACERFLAELVRDMPTFATDLRKAVTHSAGTSSGAMFEKAGRPSPDWGKTKGGEKVGKASPDFPLQRQRAEALAQLAHDVTVWVSDVADTRGLHRPAATLEPVLTVWRGCKFLGRHVSWLAARDEPNALEAWKEIRGDAAHAMDLPRDRARFVVGPCPEDCDGQVTAFIGTVDKDCAMGCDMNAEHQWNPSQFYRAGHRIKQKMDGAA